MIKYNPEKIEKKWQKSWQEGGFFNADQTSGREKKYLLVEFPYPSGEGLHIGHVRPYVAADVLARYWRAKNFEVLFPFGWDAFGLPAENYAIKNGVQPQVSTGKNIANARRQVISWGLSFDWSREVNTTDPNFYKWTQWIFLQFFKAGLAYEQTAPINWCPKDKTGLANEEVIDGRCERCGTLVERKNMRQWFLKITDYAQALIDGLEQLDWPASIKIQQQNWIGRSEGAEIDFEIIAGKQTEKITVFTTRADTLFGATYLVLAPEHKLVSEFLAQIENRNEVEAYVQQAANKSDLQRSALDKQKSGVRLKGVSAVNPATGQTIPVWIADYVLGGYGSGAIMAVPAEDLRDRQFTEVYNLPIIEVLDDSQRLINSDKFNGLDTESAKKRITEKFGRIKVQYKLRDWVFSRQRYWGEPIPLIHCEKCGVVAVPDDQLPVILPEVENYQPTGTGESPLAAISEWVNTTCPQCAGPAKRETNTMPQWAGSSWYFLRYTDPHNQKEFADSKKLADWLPVDIYFGGMEHTTLHLLYSRFWNLFLHDRGLVPVREPYAKRQPHGIILAADGEKMSKSRGNVVNPDVIVKEYGADTLRCYELFLGPHDQVVSWDEQSILGVRRFFDRVWKMIHQNIEADNLDSAHVETEINKLIERVGREIEAVKYNTAVSALMEFANNVSGQALSKTTLQKFLTVLAPLAPHISSELWSIAGFDGEVVSARWPAVDSAKLHSATVKYVVQVNGKLRGDFEIDRHASQDQVEAQAKAIDAVAKSISGPVKKIIFVQGRLINFVV